MWLIFNVIMDIEEITLDIVENSKPMPPEFAQLVNEHFWKLIDNEEK